MRLPQLRSVIERAVFLLREVFDYEYAEIAEVVGKTPTNCRQIFARARKRLSARTSSSSLSLGLAKFMSSIESIGIK